MNNNNKELFLWLVYYCKIWFSSVFICIHIPVCIDNHILRGNKFCADLMFMLSQYVSSLCWEVSHHRGLSGITSLSFWPQNQASRGPQWYKIIVFLTRHIPKSGASTSFRYIWAVQNTFCSHDLARENMLRAET